MVPLRNEPRFRAIERELRSTNRVPANALPQGTPDRGHASVCCRDLASRRELAARGRTEESPGRDSVQRSTLQRLGHFATALCELGHDLFMKPDVHRRRVRGVTRVTQFLRQRDAVLQARVES